MKYQKCMMQMGAYAMALEHTIGIDPELLMIFVATRERSQVFVVQGGTIEKYKQKWLDAVAKYYGEILPQQQAEAFEMEIIDGDKQDSQRDWAGADAFPVHWNDRKITGLKMGYP
jgi:hypothetical protein